LIDIQNQVEIMMIFRQMDGWTIKNVIPGNFTRTRSACAKEQNSSSNAEPDACLFNGKKSPENRSEYSAAWHYKPFPEKCPG
jgi:hypothetical protein